MSAKYSSLQSLLQSEGRAMKYYDSLPEIVRENISLRSGHVNSFEDLQAFAENLLGDND